MRRIPNFIFPIIIASLGLWLATGYIVCFTLPINDLQVLLLLVLLFSAVETTLTLIIFTVRNHLLPQWPERRVILRESSKLALSPALGIFLFLLLRYLTMDTAINLVVLVIFLTLAEYHLIKNL